MKTKKKKKSDVDIVRNALKHKHVARILKPEAFLSTGSTLLNLAISGKTNGGFFKGGYFYFAGDSTSGKTFLCLTCLAEACKRKDFDNYEMIYDGTTENGALMDIDKFFGSKVDQRLKLRNSETIDELYFDIDDDLNNEKPFIRIVDSMDGLDSEADKEKFEKKKKAFKKGTEAPGSYGDGKAKANSQNLRKLLKRLWNSGSILIIIGQTRDNIGAMGYGDKKTVAGGRALKFYAQLQMMSSVSHAIKKPVRGKERNLGVVSKIKVIKNRVKGRDRTVYVPIYNSYGIDDIRSCIDFLIEEKYWKGTKERVIAKDFGFKGDKEKLIDKIERKGLGMELRALVRQVWNSIEDECSLKRRPRYE